MLKINIILLLIYQQLDHLIPDGDHQLRSTLKSLESSYLSKSLARLFDTVNLLFQSAMNVQGSEVLNNQVCIIFCKFNTFSTINFCSYTK